MRVFPKTRLTIFIVLTLLVTSLSFFFQPLMPFQSIAHRGASAYAPENTMAAFHKALELGFDYIEFDVRMSKDGSLVVIHDHNVNRTTNGEGYVHDFTAKELKALDAGSWFNDSFNSETIPLLTEVLEEFGGKIGLLIELKSPEANSSMTEKLAALVRNSIENGLNSDMIKVQSFQPNEMRKFYSLVPEVSVGIVTKKALKMLHLASYRHFASFISIHQQYISKSFISKAKLFDYSIYAWTITKQTQFLVMQSQAVNGIISDLEKKENQINPLFATLFMRGHQFFKIFV